MSTYISSYSNRLYVGLETTFGAVPAVDATARIPAVKLTARQQTDMAPRRDKTGSRTFGGVPQGSRRRSEFTLATLLTGWANPAQEPGYGPLFHAATGGAVDLKAAQSVASAANAHTVQTTGNHGLTAGQAIAIDNELRFVSTVVDPQTVQLNAPFSAVPQVGQNISETVTYRLGETLPSVSLFDYWNPASAVHRIVSGAGIDRLAFNANGDYHEFEFRGPAREVIDSASFEVGDGSLVEFPEEPAPDAFDYTVVPGHLGQAWIGSAPDQFFTLTDAQIVISNDLDSRNREFGSDLPTCLVPGERNITVSFSIYAKDDAQSAALCQAAKQRSPVQVMLQLGNQPGQLFGVWMKSVMLECPQFDGDDRRLEWRFVNCRAQGVGDDEVVLAFA